MVKSYQLLSKAAVSYKEIDLFQLHAKVGADMATTAEKSEAGTWTFYVVFVLSILFEGALIKFLGFWLGGALLLFGGLALGLFSLKFTNPETKAKDPFFRASIWCLDRSGFFGYLVMAVLLGGSPGTAIAYKKLQDPRALRLTVLAAVLFAVFWTPLFFFILG